MRFPYILRRAHELELRLREERAQHAQERADRAERDRDYWRIRAERLTDAGLARTGAIHEPTMVERPKEPASLASLVTSAMGIQEIDSTQKKGAAAN